MVVVHQKPFGAVDDFSGGEFTLHVFHPIHDLALLPKLRHCDLYGGEQISLIDRLHDIAEDHGLLRLFDDVFIAESRQEDHGRRIVVGDHLRCLDAVKARHFHIEDDEIRLFFFDKIQSLHPI